MKLLSIHRLVCQVGQKKEKVWKGQGLKTEFPEGKTIETDSTGIIEWAYGSQQIIDQTDWLIFEDKGQTYIVQMCEYTTPQS